MKYGKTAAYTILKNEKKFIEQWLYYTKDFDYRVLLDTGSTDGSYEILKKEPNVIVEQKVFDPWRFDVARNYNFSMIPDDVEWCLSPDMDEYFSINVLEQMELTIDKHPNVTNISCCRLDIYSKDVFVGLPKHIGTNKIHRKADYYWDQPIYEHLKWKWSDRPEVEIYNYDIYLVHTQDFKKPERSPLYFKMLTEEYESNPSNTWTLWFLVNHYYIEKDMPNFIKTGMDFVFYKNNNREYDQKYLDVARELHNISQFADIDLSTKESIKRLLSSVHPV